MRLEQNNKELRRKASDVKEGVFISGKNTRNKNSK